MRHKRNLNLNSKLKLNNLNFDIEISENPELIPKYRGMITVNGKEEKVNRLVMRYFQLIRTIRLQISVD